MLKVPYFSLHLLFGPPKWAQLFTTYSNHLRRLAGRTLGALVYSFFFCWCFLEGWWGPTLYVEMTNPFGICLLVEARKAESGIQGMMRFPRLQGHHCSRISLTFGSRVSSSWKSSRDGVQLSMDQYLKCLVPESDLSFWLSLVSLKILLQKPFLHQASQLVAQSYASLDIMPKCFEELTPGISLWSQIPIFLLGKLQLVCYP